MRRIVILLMVLATVSLPARSSSTFSSTPVTRTRVRPIAPVVSLTLSQHAGHPAEGHGVNLAVDGAINPGAVSDERAYDLFLAAMANAKSDKTVEVALRPAGFSPSDRAAFFGAVGSLRSDFARLNAQKRASADRISQQRVILDNARGHTLRSLSPEAQQKLDHYIRTEVKKRIRLYSGPMPILRGDAQ